MNRALEGVFCIIHAKTTLWPGGRVCWCGVMGEGEVEACSASGVLQKKRVLRPRVESAHFPDEQTRPRRRVVRPSSRIGAYLPRESPPFARARTRCPAVCSATRCGVSTDSPLRTRGPTRSKCPLSLLRTQARAIKPWRSPSPPPCTRQQHQHHRVYRTAAAKRWGSIRLPLHLPFAWSCAYHPGSRWTQV